MKSFKEFIVPNLIGRVLLLNFDLSSVSTPGTEKKYARGYKTTGPLLVEMGREKGLQVEIGNFSDILFISEKILYKNEPIETFDFVVLGLLANKEELAQLILECLKKNGVPYFSYGTLHADKLHDMHILFQNGYPYVPTFVTSDPKIAVETVKKHWQDKYPVVSKVINGSQGRGVELCNSEKELFDSFEKDKGSRPGNFEYQRIVQKFIPNNGDYRVLIFNDQILTIAERKSKDKSKEFRNNLSLGGAGKIMDIPNEAKQIALGSSRVLGKMMSGVDLVQDKYDGKWYVMEVNSAPQYHYFAELAGLNFNQMLIDYIVSKIL